MSENLREPHSPALHAASTYESDAIKDARRMLHDLGSPLWPGLTESDWAAVLRGVLYERDFLGDWLQRCLDYEKRLIAALEVAAREAAGGNEITYHRLTEVAREQCGQQEADRA